MNQHIGTAGVIFLIAALTCGAASKSNVSNSTAPFPSSSNRLKRNEPVAGNLKVYIKYGHGLPDRDSIFAGKSDPYVSVTAVDNRGGRRTLTTNHIQGDHSPHWYQWLYFGARSNWHHLDMSVWDNDVGSDDRLTDTQQFHLSAGYHRHLRHCSGNCAVYFDYNLITGAIIGRLRIWVRYGHSLPDRDGWLAGDSDPYVKMVAYNRNGHSSSLQTSHRQGDESPEWNQWLDFGVDSWSSFSVQVYDRDPGRDDSLSNIQRYHINSHISRTSVIMNCHSGYIVFDYYYQP